MDWDDGLTPDDTDELMSLELDLDQDLNFCNPTANLHDGFSDTPFFDDEDLELLEGLSLLFSNVQPMKADVAETRRDVNGNEDEPHFKTYDLFEEDLTLPRNPELCTLVDPTKILRDFKREGAERSEINRNNEAGSSSEDETLRSEVIQMIRDISLSENEATKDKDELHVDHCYSSMPKEMIVKVEPESVAIKRRVGRPKKVKKEGPARSQPMKKKLCESSDEYSEMVDVEAGAPKKRRGRKPKVTNASLSPVASTSYATPSCSYATPSTSYATDSKGFVMRPAKTSAIKKIAKTTKKKTTKKNSPVSPTKRNLHNQMERERRNQIRKLFDRLKVVVDPDLLKDANGKSKKNPSRNIILIGARLQNHSFNDLRDRLENLAEIQRNMIKNLNRMRRKLGLIRRRRFPPKPKRQ